MSATEKHPDEAGHVADAVRDACLQVIGKVVSFDDSRKIANLILHHQAFFNSEYQKRIVARKANQKLNDWISRAIENAREGQSVRTAPEIVEAFWKENPSIVETDETQDIVSLAILFALHSVDQQNTPS